MQREILFWIWLADKLGAQNRDFRRLISLYESAYEIFHTEETELDRIDGISQYTKNAIADKEIGRASEILARCEQMNIGVLTFADERYPQILRDIKAPPIVLYYSGTLPDFNTGLKVGMVGTRRMSAYGLRTAYKIAYELASAGAMIVSGMAAGIDGVSAAGAIGAGGRTVAVLGCGVDVVYPKHHKPLMDAIRQNGVILSEYAPGTRPSPYHFPIRNRIISGLSHGTVVVEAGMKSGSLITAKDAILQGRDVFALPANVGSDGTAGTNGLLRDGANLVLDTADIVEHYRCLYADWIDVKAFEASRGKSGADFAALGRYGVITQEDAERFLHSDNIPATAEIALPKAEKRQRTSVDKKAGAPKADAPKKETGSVRTQSPKEIKKDTPEEEPKQARQTPSEVLSSLTPAQLAIMQAMPDDRPVTADSLGGLGYPYSDIIAALTMLEILGLIRKLPGALYSKA